MASALEGIGGRSGHFSGRVRSSRGGGGGGGRRQNNNGADRGRGRGGRSNGGRGRNNFNWSKKARAKKLEVFTGSFVDFHRDRRANRYKVHRPGCDCSRVQRARGQATKDDASSTFAAAEDPFDGLLVFQEQGSFMSFYRCEGTGASTFEQDRVSAEKVLRQTIYAADEETEENVDFKLSCANCLLLLEPNGFACVKSSSRYTIDFIRDMARRDAQQTLESDHELHSDHAHHVCTLPRHCLANLEASKTRTQSYEANEFILKQLKEQGIPAAIDQTVKMGHHLKELLDITKHDDPDSKNSFWFIIVYDDTHDPKELCWTLDIPGGKRHLGESKFDCVVRETSEETSLTLDASWLAEKKPRRSRKTSSAGNCYFIFIPPTSLVMENLTEDLGKAKLDS